MNDEPETTRAWASAARTWWRALQPYDDQGRANWTGDRGSLARLRNAHGLADVLAEESLMDLYDRLGFRSGELETRLDWVVVTATILAGMKSDRVVPPKGGPATPFCRALGPNRQEFANAKRAESQASKAEISKRFASAFLKPLRLRRLTQTREPFEFARQMRRSIALLPRIDPRSGDDRLRGIDIGHLAADILSWPHPERGDQVRARWLFHYIPSAWEQADEIEIDLSSEGLP